MNTRILLCAMMFAAAGCATREEQMRPVLYPADSLHQKSQVEVQRDIAECDAKAQRYFPPEPGSEKARRVALSALESAVVGTAAGAVGGSIVSKAGRGAGAGAAIGGLTGAYGALKEESKVSPKEREFLKACLEEKGYKVIGWEGER